MKKRKRIYTDYLRDILDELQLIAQFIHGMEYQDFLRDKKTQRAVEKCLGNMGEASKKIPDSLRKRFTDIPFKEMSKTREIIIHDYDGINYMIVWETITTDIPPLENKIQDMLDHLESEDLRPPTTG